MTKTTALIVHDKLEMLLFGLRTTYKNAYDETQIMNFHARSDEHMLKAWIRALEDDEFEAGFDWMKFLSRANVLHKHLKGLSK